MTARTTPPPAPRGAGEAAEGDPGRRPWREPDPRRMDAPAGPRDEEIIAQVLGPALRAWAAWLRDGGGDGGGDAGETDGPPEAVRYPATVAGLAYCLRSLWRRPANGRARQLAVAWHRELGPADRDLLGRLASLDELTLTYCAPNALRYRLGLRAAPRGAEEGEGRDAGLWG